MLQGLPYQSSSMTDSASQIHQTFIKTISAPFFKFLTIIVITTEYAECDLPLLWMQDQTPQQLCPLAV